MQCSNCNQADLENGTTTVAFERDGISYTFKKVPAQVCPKCAHATVDEKINDNITLRADVLKDSGAKVYIREY